MLQLGLPPFMSTLLFTDIKHTVAPHRTVPFIMVSKSSQQENNPVDQDMLLPHTYRSSLLSIIEHQDLLSSAQCRQVSQFQSLGSESSNFLNEFSFHICLLLGSITGAW
mmetsp:Transcript_30364/g.97761  ORF Transcript_30364/g.97761 Transcript_30364/m.97761 type:complete len:109 (+) Transcript_30364:1273-1599(+)